MDKLEVNITLSWYNDGMTTSDWINLIAAILVGGGTLFLGIMAWRSIRQTRSIQKSEKRERLLNEVIDWAVGISNWRIENKRIFSELAHVEGLKQRVELFHAHITETMQSFAGMRGKNLYVNKVALKFDQSLQKALAEIINNMESYIGFLNEWDDNFDVNMPKNKLEEQIDQAKKADKLMQSLERSANKVIEEAVKIKNRDIDWY